MKEKDLLKLISDYLIAKKYLFYRQNSGAFVNKQGSFYKFASISGLPDLVVILPPNGQYVAVELKAGKNKLSNNQIFFGEKLVEAGGKYIVARSLEDLIRELN